MEEILLAREQARLGLLDEARAAWDRAIALLAPLAAKDPAIAEQVAQIESERDLARRDADVRVELADTPDEEEEPTDSTAESIVKNADPQLDPVQLPDVGKAAQEVTADYPIVLNDRVYAWIEAWTGNLRGFFSGSLERSGMYTERFRQIFAEEGLPQDLVYLAHVESGFKTTAYSSAAARGIFQFIAETGRRYGLVANWWLDERADPEKSARASAAYLRDLYAEFGDWYMAMAAYNAGEGKVRSVIARTGKRDFFDPANQRLFVSQTRNYVPAILAATIIAKNPAKFGFTVAPAKPLSYDIVTVPTPTSLEVLAEVAKTELETLKALNPSLRRHSTPPAYADFVLKVPVGHAEGFAERLAKVPPDDRLIEREHIVRRGETVARVARKYGISTRALVQANQLGRRPRLISGQVLVIPEGPSAAPDPVLDAPRGTAKYYRVRRGDSLGAIARKYGVSTKQLQAWNKLGKSTRIAKGQRLRVSAPAKASRGETQVASAKAKASGKGSAVRAAGSRHTVKRGETLSRIAARYGVTVSDLASANGMGRNGALRAGQKLVIPGGGADRDDAPAATKSAKAGTAKPKVHVVKRGETLYRIARRFGTSVDALCKLNNLSPGAVLVPGDTLTVPR